MEGLGVLLVVVGAFVANLPALKEQWPTTRMPLLSAGLLNCSCGNTSSLSSSAIRSEMLTPRSFGARRTLTNRCLPISIYEYTA